MARPAEKGCDAMYGRDYARYKDIRDALNDGAPVVVDEKTGVMTPLDDYVGSKSDPVNSPSHYNSGGIEAIEAIEASLSDEGYRGALKANVIKYMWRYEKKAKPIEDLKKARWYLDRLIQKVEGA